MKHLAQNFDWVEFVLVPQSQNTKANEIAKQASSEVGSTFTDLKMEVQKRPSIEEFHTFAIQSENSWMTPILFFL